MTERSTFRLPSEDAQSNHVLSAASVAAVWIGSVDSGEDSNTRNVSRAESVRNQGTPVPAITNALDPECHHHPTNCTMCKPDINAWVVWPCSGV